MSLPKSKSGTGILGLFAMTLPQMMQVLALPRIWLRRAKMRHELSMLSEEQMRDVGLDRQTARRESKKPFWQP
jgi:uncharacterized protein YjiS (DUF1127 family)